MFKRLLIAMVFVCLGRAEAGEVVLLDTPCRLYDSRNVGGTGLGSKISSTTVSTWGTPGGSQGGESACGIPSSAVGVFVGLTVYQPTSAGFARVWAYGETEPLSAAITFASAQQDEVTGVLIKTGTDGKISVNLPYGTAHVIIDLAGWVSEEAATTFFKGEILAIDGGTIPPSCSVTLTSTFPSFYVVLKEPWIDPARCDSLEVGHMLCGTGHISPSFSVNSLYAHTTTDCQ